MNENMVAAIKSLIVGTSLLIAMSVSNSALAVEPPTAREYEVTAKGPLGPLAGSLLNLGQGAPLVLILPGSGPTDRNGNNPMGVRAASYKLLAAALAEKGISTLRIDKRGMFGSATAVADPNSVTIADYTTDTRNWIDVGLKESKANCVWLAGHSEGGLIAMAVAQTPDKLCGVILIAAPGRNLADIMLEQLRENPANIVVLPDAERAIASLRAGKIIDVSGMHPALHGLFAAFVQGFLIDMFSNDPAALVAGIKLPTLIIQGGRDIQVRAADAAALAKGQPEAKIVTIDAMTHVLKRADANGPAASIATYGNPDLPVMPELIEAITTFVKPSSLQENGNA
jgi:pimeloyl-ACP methyl ester carboxylesterase